MQEFQQIVPDEEMFRRVWSRVMPDESLSQVVVKRPEGDRPPRPAPPRPSERPPERPEGDRELLRRVLEALDEGLALARGLNRRQPGAVAVADSLRRDAAQARMAWFFLTGRRWVPTGAGIEPRESADELLRRLYLWEVGFSRLCRDGERQAREEDLRELFEDLREHSRRRRGVIRTMGMRR